MDQNEDYILILKDSLKKKKDILDELIVLNERQKNAVLEEQFDSEEFEAVFDEKDKYISRIDELDRGFQNVYDHVKKELADNPDKYKEDIIELKKLIADVTEKSMEIQLSEKRNEKMVYSKLSEERQKVHQSRTANRVAADYYKNMSRVNVVDPQFLDKKK